MVLKLLEPNPQCRLKSLREIKIQLFFHGFNFSDIASKKVIILHLDYFMVLIMQSRECLIQQWFDLLFFQYKPNEILQKLAGKMTQNNQELPHFEELDD